MESVTTGNGTVKLVSIIVAALGLLLTGLITGRYGVPTSPELDKLSLRVDYIDRKSFTSVDGERLIAQVKSLDDRQREMELRLAAMPFDRLEKTQIAILVKLEQLNEVLREHDKQSGKD